MRRQEELERREQELDKVRREVLEDVVVNEELLRGVSSSSSSSSSSSFSSSFTPKGWKLEEVQKKLDELGKRWKKSVR
ncbi:hypothetical protein AGMMS49921_01650 [Endomicrobiia bacterium]|nr:hypothetical protein AGMMS49921_01650 [Endomicrobiia bacterium]